MPGRGVEKEVARTTAPGVEWVRTNGRGRCQGAPSVMVPALVVASGREAEEVSVRLNARTA